jgi:hypothetical protein
MHPRRVVCSVEFAKISSEVKTAGCPLSFSFLLFEFEKVQYSLGKSKVVTERSDSVTTQIVSLAFVR